MGSFGVVGWAWLVLDALLSQGCVWFDVGVSEGAGRVGEAGGEQDGCKHETFEPIVQQFVTEFAVATNIHICLINSVNFRVRIVLTPQTASTIGRRTGDVRTAAFAN